MKEYSGFQFGSQRRGTFLELSKSSENSCKEFVERLGNIPGTYGLFAKLVPYKFDSICGIMFQLFQLFPSILERTKATQFKVAVKQL